MKTKDTDFICTNSAKTRILEQKSDLNSVGQRYLNQKSQEDHKRHRAAHEPGLISLSSGQLIWSSFCFSVFLGGCGWIGEEKFIFYASKN